MLHPFLSLQETLPAAASGLQIHFVDWIGLGLAAIFMLLGFLRGLWWQVIRLLGLMGSVVLARTFSAPWGEALQGSTQLSSEVATGIVWLGLFLVGLVLTAVVGTMGKKSLQAIQLGLMDRAGGVLAGLATGVLLHTAGLVAVAHLAPQEWSSKVLEGTYSRGLLQFVTTRYAVLTQQETHASDVLFRWLGTGSDVPASLGGPGPKVK